MKITKKDPDLDQVGEYLFFLAEERDMMCQHTHVDRVIKAYGMCEGFPRIVEIDYSVPSQILLYFLDGEDIIYCGEKDIADPKSIDWITHWLDAANGIFGINPQTL